MEAREPRPEDGPVRAVIGYGLVALAAVLTLLVLVRFYLRLRRDEIHAGPRLVYEAALLSSLVLGGGVFALTNWWSGLLAVFLHGGASLGAIAVMDRWV